MGFEPAMFAGLLAFVTSAVAIVALEGPARRFGLIDHPCERKRHDGVVPLTGGIAIALGWAIAASMVLVDWAPYWSLMFGAVVMLAIGVLDDRLRLPALPRLVLQVLVGAMMVGAGVQVLWLGDVFGWGPIGLGLVSVPFTILAVALMINAVNMMDGMDGLSGGVAFLALGGLGIVALDAGLSSDALLAALLASALAGFLVFNVRSTVRSRARVFLGDGGSMLLGLALAWFAVTLGGKPDTGVAPVTVAWFLLLPAGDSLGVMVRRALRGRNPLGADRSHAHHVLLRSGFSVQSAWGVIMAVQALLVVAGVGGHLLGVPEWIQFGLLAGLLFGFIAASVCAGRILRNTRRVLRRSAILQHLSTD